ncbi:MAG: NAD-dependent epimerase/dehydratase family protein [Syntrophobacteraceae bacterium]|jgi:dolichol-phosphate mannosyltransferase
MSRDLEHVIARLQGPILILGASGFIGSNLLRMILDHRSDVVGTSTYPAAWRLEKLPEENLRAVDLLVESNLDNLLEDVKPRTVFNCVAYGAYSFQQESELIYETNFNLTAKLLEKLALRKIACYVHAGSSSEYGDHVSGPVEDDLPAPNSDYAVSKVACANLLYYYGRKKKLPCANLRLYSVYGPMEDSARLIPTVVRCGSEGRYPEFVNPAISRDFIYVDEACEAFIKAALYLREENYGDSFNIGSGRKTTIHQVTEIAGELFGIGDPPSFSMPARHWDTTFDWFANSDKARGLLNWESNIDFRDGLIRTIEWYRNFPDKEKYQRLSKQYGLDTKYSVSAVIACYKDAQAIPIMYERLKKTFEKLRIEHEIIFVNDNSPDESEEVIRELTRRDRRVIGVSHSRNFGSQSAFRSGMEITSKNACVLLDGDLQDPPELIESFVLKWREGYDVVYGRRVKREAPLFMQFAYKLFYRVFDKFSYLPIPRDAGDFSLLDKQVMHCMLQFPERDLFLRGVRAFVGFKQTGVDYIRPERMFGRSTNNLVKNVAWAKKGILSFSTALLSLLSFLGGCLFLATLLLGFLQVISRILVPGLAPKGVTTLLISILFFGSINLLAIGIIGEYIAKIFEEVKRRPHFIRRNIIEGGQVRASANKRMGA